MRLTKANKEKIRLHIQAGAADLFRKHGFDGVSIDDLMATANLTRGAFYAHFKSKSDLFETVIQNEHALLTMLKTREGRTAAKLWAEMLEIFSNYLAPEHNSQVSKGCTLAALGGDVARASRAAKEAYTNAWQATYREMSRGQNDHMDHAALRSALILAVGAVTTAGAAATKEQKSRILIPVHQTFITLVETARGAPQNRQSREGL